MMRAAFTASLSAALIAMSSAAEISLNVTMGQLSGKATLVNQILPNGTKYVRLAMTLKSPEGRSATILQESTYESNGRPIRKLQVTSMNGGDSRRSTVVTFGNQGATCTVEEGGKKTTEEFAYPESARINATPEFWFIRDAVTAGGVSSYVRFDVDQRAWVETKSTFVGKREISWEGKTVTANLVTIDAAKAWLDDKGDPYMIEAGDAKMVRIGSGK